MPTLADGGGSIVECFRWFCGGADQALQNLQRLGPGVVKDCNAETPQFGSAYRVRNGGRRFSVDESCRG